jgi:hypothetical protein
VGTNIKLARKPLVSLLSFLKKCWKKGSRISFITEEAVTPLGLQLGSIIMSSTINMSPQRDLKSPFLKPGLKRMVVKLTVK